MLRKALTLATAIVAVGGAFAGSAHARNLLVTAGWVRASDNSPISTEVAMSECTGSDTSCAYFFANEGDTEPEITLFRDAN